MSRNESVVEQPTKESEIEKPIVDESSWKQELEQLDRLLTGRLTEAARKQREQSILKCGAGIEAAKDADKLRPRWQELRKRQQAIDAAKDVARGKEQELRVSMPQRFV